MYLVGENKHGLIFRQHVFFAVDRNIHASVGYDYKLKALVHMRRITEVFTVLLCKIIRRAEM